METNNLRCKADERSVRLSIVSQFPLPQPTHISISYRERIRGKSTNYGTSNLIFTVSRSSTLLQVFNLRKMC